MAVLGRIRILSTVVIAFLGIALACSVAPAAESKRVMLLHSFGRDFKPWSDYAKEIRTDADIAFFTEADPIAANFDQVRFVID